MTNNEKAVALKTNFGHVGNLTVRVTNNKKAVVEVDGVLVLTGRLSADGFMCDGCEDFISDRLLDRAGELTDNAVNVFATVARLVASGKSDFVHSHS